MQPKAEQNPSKSPVSHTSEMKEESYRPKTPLRLGYYPLRGRAQVPRLILEYLKLDYVDELFQNQKEWIAYKNQHEKGWPMLALPFLIDGDVKITETVPICNYLISKYAEGSQKMMLGRNLKDATILEMYTWSIDNMGVGLVALCWMQGPPELVAKRKERFWIQNLEQKMYALEVYIGDRPWMFGYLSLFDFSIYQLIHYVGTVFPRKLQQFPKLLEIQRKVGQLPEIKDYESSSRAIKTLLPTQSNKQTK